MRRNSFLQRFHALSFAACNRSNPEMDVSPQGVSSPGAADLGHAAPSPQPQPGADLATSAHDAGLPAVPDLAHPPAPDFGPPGIPCGNETCTGQKACCAGATQQ